MKNRIKEILDARLGATIRPSEATMTYVLKRLYEVQYTLNPTHFNRIFEGRHPLHLWNAFRTTHESNLLAFFNNLDNDNKALFLQYLIEKDRHDGSPETKN